MRSLARGSTTSSPEAQTGYFDFPYYVTQATWTSPLTSRLLLDAGFTRFSYYHAGGPGQLPPDGIEIFWGAYLGTADEILISGPLGEVADDIARVRAEARERRGWIFDTYLLRRT